MSDTSRPIWTRRVRNAVKVKGPPRCVLMMLADRADENGIAWPGQAQLAEDSGVTDRTVRAALKSLQEAGYIERVGSKFGADIWRVTVDESGNATGSTASDDDRKDVPPEAPSAATGRTFLGDRKDVPQAPEGRSDKEPMKVPLKDPGKGEPAPASVTNTEPKPRRHVTGSSQMPTTSLADPDEAQRIREAIRERITFHAGSCPLAPADWTGLQKLVVASGYDEAVALTAIDWLYTAADDMRWGGNEAAYTVGRGIGGALMNRSLRLVEASAEWAKAGRPTRNATKAAAQPQEDAAVLAWRDMEPRFAAGTHNGARVLPHNPTGCVLADDDAEHERRRLAWATIGTCKAWGMSENDFQRRDLRDRWLLNYRALLAKAVAA